MQKDTILYLYVTWNASIFASFAVSFTPETPNFGTFDGVTHPPLLSKYVYAHYAQFKFWKKLILRKINLSVQNPLTSIYLIQLNKKNY